MRTSEQINELAKALAAAQGEFTNPERNREVQVVMKNGGTYTFAYSTLDCVMDMARPILAKHGLSVTQPATVRDNAVHVLTRLMHASGQWQEEEISVKPEGFGPQQIGSAITYLKRYAYCGMIGIASEEDDDGNAASGNHAVQTPKSESDLPACPHCATNAHVIKGKEEYGGGYLCFKKKGGCGAKWSDDAGKTADERAKNVARQHGLTPASQLPPKNGSGKPSGEQPTKENIDLANAFGNRLRACWRQESIDEVTEELSKLTPSNQWLKDQMRGPYQAALSRAALLQPDDGDKFSDDQWESLLIEISKSPSMDDFEMAYEGILMSQLIEVSESQRLGVMRALERWYERREAKASGAR